MLSENEKRIQELSRELGACLYEQSQIKKFNRTIKDVGSTGNIYAGGFVKERVEVEEKVSVEGFRGV
jgi:hypothetical protein